MSQLLMALDKRRSNHQQMQYNFVANIMGDLEASLAIDSITAPFPTFDTKNVYTNGIYSPSASKRNTISISVKFIELETQEIGTYLYSWLRSIQNEDGTYNPPAIYKKTVVISPLNSKMAETTTYTLKGAYLSEVSPVSYDYDSTGNVYYEATMVCDDVIYGTTSSSNDMTSQDNPTKLSKGKMPDSKIS